MTATRSRAFQSGNSVAVRLPKQLAFPIGTELEIDRNGDVVTIRPARKSIEWLVDQLRSLPEPEKRLIREPLEYPDRVWDR